MEDSTEPAPKRVKTLADDSNGFSLGDQRVLLGSKGLVKRSEFIKIMIQALMSLGYHDVAAHLEEKSGIPLQSSITKEFLELVNNGEWDRSIVALQGLELKDDKAVKFCLLVQKFFDFLKIEDHLAAMHILIDKMVPLGVSMKRLEQLSYKLITATGEDTEILNSRSKVVEKLRKLLPPAVIIPERRLEYLLANTLDRLGARRGEAQGSSPSIDEARLFDKGARSISPPPEARSTPRRASAKKKILEEHRDEVWYLEFSHNGKYLASSSKDKSAIIWEMDAEKKFWRKHALVGHEKPVVMVLWSPDDRQVITCGEEEVIRRWDAESGQCVHVYTRNGVGSVSCGWFHDGSGITGAMADRRIYLWNLDGKTQTVDRYKVIRDEDTITSFTLSKDNKYMLNNLSSEEINIWFIETDDPYKHYEYKGHKSRRFIIRSCFGGYEESFVTSGSEDSQVYIWHREESEKPLRVLKGHSRTVKCVSWNPSDIHMLASDDGTIPIWELATS